MTRVAVYIESETARLLRLLARRNKTTVSALVREAIFRQYVRNKPKK